MVDRIVPGCIITPALRDKLEEEFPLEAHRVLEKKGAKITHVPIWEYVRRLNDLDPTWSSRIVRLEQTVSLKGKTGDNELPKLVAVVELTINGVTRSNAGEETSSEDLYGSDATNAVAQAFKRACALFGLGLYLYDKDRANEIARLVTNPPKAASRPASKAAKPDGKLYTSSQANLIGEMVKSHVFTDEERDAIKTKLKADPTQARASLIIEWLKKELPLRKMKEDPRAAAAIEELDLVPTQEVK